MKTSSLWCLSFVLLGAAGAFAAETDQFTDRALPLADSREVINEKVNDSIREVVSEWKGKRDNFELAQKVRWTVEGALFIHRLSRWAVNNPRIEHIVTKDHSIYRGIPIRISTIGPFGTMAETIKVNNVRLGIDKLSHMFSVGWGYYTTFWKSGEAKAISVGEGTEKGFLGWYTTGVYSNADIVANFEGQLFYRSLYEDGAVAGKPALVRWEGNTPVIQNEFDIADHVTEYWDETINTSQFREGVAKFVLVRLRGLCPSFQENPALWTIDPARDAELQDRYKKLSLWENTQYRLEQVCAE